MTTIFTYNSLISQPSADRGNGTAPTGGRNLLKNESHPVPPATCPHVPRTILNSAFLILNWSFTFSAKERDPETGLSYFGSRYYSSDLSIWLSVDPMSDKYASLSPYVYCADNPVKLVDPNGEDVFICGASPDSKSDAEAAEKAFEYLVGSAKNLSLERDSKTGRLSATIKEGAQLSEDEQILYDAIMDQEVVVNLSVSINNLYKGRATEFGAGFYGNKLGENASGLGHAFAFTDQFVCLPVLKQNYFESDIGGVIMHEITESHYGGCASLVSGIAAEMAIGDTPAYVAAHNNAAPCPPSAETKICQMLNISRKQYNDLKSKLNGYNSFK